MLKKSKSSVPLAKGIFKWGPDSALLVAGEAKTEAERALFLIRHDIVSAHYSPGERLKPEELKERYTVGISPIREALLRLTAEGLVKLEGKRGFQVPSASTSELVDIAKVRSELSCLALQEAISLGNDDWEAGIVAAFHRLERTFPLMLKNPREHAQEWERRNRDFHAALESGCNSPWLLHFNAMAFAQSERYRRHFVDYGYLLPDAQKEHHDIMTAALNRNAEAACEQLRHHIAENMSIVMGYMLNQEGAKRMHK
jgi:DNA-binding GntR family transcriptional regulator